MIGKNSIKNDAIDDVEVKFDRGIQFHINDKFKGWKVPLIANKQIKSTPLNYLVMESIEGP